MQIFKFGGASLKNALAIKNMAEIVKDFCQKPTVIVVSAMGKTTQALEETLQSCWEKKQYLAHIEKIHTFHNEIIGQLFDEATATSFSNTVIKDVFQQLEKHLKQVNSLSDYDKAYDQIVAFGEILSSKIVAYYLDKKHSFNCAWLDIRKYIITDSTFRGAKVVWAQTQTNIEKLKNILTQKTIITQGFIGSNSEGETTTLGREGSDFSAAIFANCLSAESLTIWKDVAGVMNADPKKMKDAVLYEQLSYDEAAEMTYYGASVIHPKTIKPLANKKIPLYVKSFEKPNMPGTKISQEKSKKKTPTIVFKTNQHLLSFKVKDFTFINEQHLSLIFQVLSSYKVRINLMQNSAISFSVCIDYDARKLELIFNKLTPFFNVTYNKGLDLITIINPNKTTIKNITLNKKVALEQKTRHTYQIVVFS